MSILKDLPELVSANLITDETARKISDYYQGKQTTSPNKQLLIFGILGAVLVGIGLLFIIANQWDELSRATKTACAFLLLIVPQSLVGYVLTKKQDKIIWRESTALLLFFAVGANISLLSQIYHVSGEATSFILTWILLAIPLIYLANSSAISLACLIGAMCYRFAVSVEATDPSETYLFWLLFVLPMPHYFLLIRKSPDYLLSAFHHWVIPLVLTVSIQIISQNSGELMSPVYMSMFAIFILIGKKSIFTGKPLVLNGYKIFGFAGTVVTLLVMTFQSNWEKLANGQYEFGTLMATPEFVANVILFIIATLLFYQRYRNRSLADWKLTEITYWLFLLLFFIGTFTHQSYILVNILVLIWAVILIRDGSRLNHLGVLNTGMIVLTLLVTCRAFDTDLSFVAKGSLFVLVGIGFFLANWLILKKRKENEA
jgi:uncharacterized membrane protein